MTPVETRLETAVRTFLEGVLAGEGLTATCVQGWSDVAGATPPIISVLASQSDAELSGEGPTGNMDVTIDVEVRTHAGDVSSASHAQLEAVVRAALFADGLPSSLSSEDLAVMTAVPTRFSRRVDGDRRCSVQAVDCYVCPL